MTNAEQLAHAAELLRSSRSVACLTGAGVSAESGMATFRDAQTGLWAKFDPQQLASQSGFAANPELVWQWYMARLQQVTSVEPNAGHIALARLEALVSDFKLFTQNVDDLHERAGSRQVAHLHGTIARFRCNRCDRAHELQPNEQSAPHPPRCQHCGGLVRPAVVWFGERLPPDILDAAQRAAAQCDLMLVIGTSGVVYPAAQLPLTAQAHGAKLIAINSEPTPITTAADLFLQGPSGQILPQLLGFLTGE